MLTTAEQGGNLLDPVPADYFRKIENEERGRREAFPTRLHRSADDYLVKRGQGMTLIAGYPWFADWGRDTFVSIRGLCFSSERWEAAGSILLSWSDKVSQGMLPNRFPDQGELPEYNSADASLWYVVAVGEFLKKRGREISRGNQIKLLDTVDSILSAYAKGTRYGIQLDSDFLMQVGTPGTQLTWMDAKVDGIPVTPRVGKPVEIQALWLNSLHAIREHFPKWDDLYQSGLLAFQDRFWNEKEQCLYDVVDVNQQKGVLDASVRPNQIFAVGGLPLSLLSQEKARRVVDKVESLLLTPLGLRSLSPVDPAYRGQYWGDAKKRDGDYHQGTVWPWLMAPFVEAWVRAGGGSAKVKEEARIRFAEPFLRNTGKTGLGHLPEIADGDPPFTPRGCPFQAWSVGEALRMTLEVLR